MLIAKRVAAGADTPIGHRCSNLIEMLETYRTAEQKATCKRSSLFIAKCTRLWRQKRHLNSAVPYF